MFFSAKADKIMSNREEGFGYEFSFHKIILGVVCRDGDFTHHNDTGGNSICAKKCEDENFTPKNPDPGILFMVNTEPNTSG